MFGGDHCAIGMAETAVESFTAAHKAPGCPTSGLETRACPMAAVCRTDPIPLGEDNTGGVRSPVAAAQVRYRNQRVTLQAVRSGADTTAFQAALVRSRSHTGSPTLATPATEAKQSLAGDGDSAPAPGLEADIPYSIMSEASRLATLHHPLKVSAPEEAWSLLSRAQQEAALLPCVGITSGGGGADRARSMCAAPCSKTTPRPTRRPQ